MGEVDAAGDVVTGALLARAVEPHAGEGGYGHGELCLNCGTALIGPHCHRCGQAGHVHRTLGSIGHDLLHGVFHFEGKLWNTLPMLAWRPGQLTRRYIEGERARFVSPIAIFLFSIFALFATFSMLGVSPLGNLGATPDTAAEVAEMKQGLAATRDRFATERSQLAANDRRRATLDKTIADLDAKIAQVQIGKPVAGVTGTDVNVDTGWKRLDHGIEKAVKDPALAGYKLQSNSYKFSWLLIPLSLPFMWLLFAFRRSTPMYDHAVFVTYSIAFMSLLFVGVSLLGAIGIPGRWAEGAALVIVPLHLYSQLKDAYGLGRLSAIVRTLVLLVFSFIVMLLFFAIILAMGLLG